MSFGNMQYQQNFQQQQQLQRQQQQQHPLLAAISGNNYAHGQIQRAHHLWPQQMPHYGYGHGHPLQAAGSNNHNGAYASAASAHSGYGRMDPSVEYELHQSPHSASGSYSSYQPSSSGSSGPAYPPPPLPHYGPPPQYHSSGGKPPAAMKKSKNNNNKKKSASAVMSSLTLLSFFFFVNLLQNCIKDHMATMNPTVMVLTATNGRNRFNKLAEMNSREQSSSSTASSATSSWLASETMEGAALTPLASAAPAVPIVTPAVTLQSPYSPNKQQQHSKPAQAYNHYAQHDDDDYNYGQRTPYSQSQSQSQSDVHATSTHSGADFYPNRTHIDQQRPTDYYQHHYSNYPDRHHYTDPGYPWSYRGDSHVSNKRYSSAPWSSASLGAHSGVSSYLDNVRQRGSDANVVEILNCDCRLKISLW
ncbi:uncharacterized protein LOC115620353 [Scaptodrosophila lebanonensis]|uniref:Uncharacterized protein LOC115620353 n=1 Tax=Drosophila lebanonensis TaxID=7225 RepID=A0A6J2T3F5_DROLE|nr:uncharacterized protein LOC115620353 [Scaptodrosophila lebanonensis]